MAFSRRSVLAASSAFAATSLVSKSALAAPAWEARSGLSPDAYQAKFNQMTTAGFRPVVVDGYNVGGQPQFAAIWRQTPGPDWTARHGLDSDSYQQVFDQMSQSGFRPRWVSPYEDGGVKYAAIFGKGGPAFWIARHGLKQDAFQAEFDKNVANGYRLTNVGVAGSLLQGPTYAGVWDRNNNGMAWEARSAMDPDAYQAKFDDMFSKGFRLKQVCGYNVIGKPFFTAIWDKSSGPAWEAHHNLTSAQFQAKFDELSSKDFWLADVSGYDVGGQATFAGIWEKAPS